MTSTQKELNSEVCKGCAIFDYCRLVTTATEYIEQCPCHICLVQSVCQKGCPEKQEWNHIIDVIIEGDRYAFK
jgi:hypothetical protein